jgi:cell division transport system permease protein
MSTMGTVRRAFRGVREHLAFTLLSAGVIACALLLLGFFILVTGQARHMVGTWEADAHISAYFKADIPESARQQVREAIAARPEVAHLEYVSEAQARDWLVTRTPELTPVLGGLGDGVLPASLEITLTPDATSAGGVAAFVATLQAQSVWEDVDFGQEWVARFHTFLSLLSVMGTALGLVVLVVTVFLVANTIHLVVHARRDEIEILRLVGATNGFIYGPFLLEGALQGLLGAAVGLGALYAVHQGVLLRAHALIAVATGDATLAFVPAPVLVALAAGGLVLGTLGAWTAVHRFARQMP